MWKKLFAWAIYRPRAKYSLKGLKSLTIFAKDSTLDVWQSSKYTSALYKLGKYYFFFVTLENSTSFLINPWKFHMLFPWCPWKFHTLNPLVWIFFWNSPMWKRSWHAVQMTSISKSCSRLLSFESLWPHKIYHLVIQKPETWCRWIIFVLIFDLTTVYKHEKDLQFYWLF